MTREDLKDLICAVVEKMSDSEDAPRPACGFGDKACDVTTYYAVGEEDGNGGGGLPTL